RGACRPAAPAGSARRHRGVLRETSAGLGALAMDLTHIEAFLRNLLYRFGQETGLPITGRDWELGVAAVVILILLLLWSWPTRRAFRIGSSLRWLVAVLNLGS